MTFGENLKLLLKEKNIDQKHLAKILNISPSTISGYVTNYRSPNDEIKSKIADFFDVSLDWLMGRSEIRSPKETEKQPNPSNYLDISDLPEEAVKHVEDYIGYIREKYAHYGKP